LAIPVVASHIVIGLEITKGQITPICVLHDVWFLFTCDFFCQCNIITNFRQKQQKLQIFAKRGYRGYDFGLNTPVCITIVIGFIEIP
jgi:hypothetical protein